MNTRQRTSLVIRRLAMETLIALSTVGALGMLPEAPAMAYEPVAPWQLAQGSLYSSPAGQFEVAFPTPPEVTTEDDDIEGEPIEIHVFETSNGTSQYMVAYSDLPATFLSQGTDTVLDDLRDSFEDIDPEDLKAVEIDVQLGDYPGRRYRYSHDAGTIDMRLYLVDQRAYLLLAVDDNQTDVDRFISSFALL